MQEATGYIYDDNTICNSLYFRKPLPLDGEYNLTYACPLLPCMSSCLLHLSEQTSSRQFMTQCKDNTKEEEDEREQERSTTGSEEQGICAALMGESGKWAVSHQKEMETQNRTSMCCKLKERADGEWQLFCQAKTSERWAQLQLWVSISGRPVLQTERSWIKDAENCKL